MNFDLTIWGPIIGSLIPFLLPLFPGLKNILAIVPKGVWAAMIKAVDPGASVTWSTNAHVLRGELETRRARLLAKVTAGSATAEDEAALERTGAELAAIPGGGILDMLKSNPMIIIAIVGGVILFTQGGGCKKQPPNPQPGPPPATTK